ncbi:MAG: hypothetical protein WB771_00945 [Solirubrobacterales bacterium]
MEDTDLKRWADEHPCRVPRHQPKRIYLRVSARHGKNPAKSAVARKLLITAWHMLSRREPFKPAPANSRCFLTA